MKWELHIHELSSVAKHFKQDEFWSKFLELSIAVLHGPDLSLCVFVWECSDGSKQTSHMGIFDMNRWYHAQMPTTVR